MFSRLTSPFGGDENFKVWEVAPVATYRTQLGVLKLFVSETIQYNSEYIYKDYLGDYGDQLLQRPFMSRTFIQLQKDNWGLGYFANHNLTIGKVFNYLGMEVVRTWNYNHTGFEISWAPQLTHLSQAADISTTATVNFDF